MNSNLTPEEIARNELYAEIQKGLDDVAAGRTCPWEEVKAELMAKIKTGCFDFHENAASSSV